MKGCARLIKRAVSSGLQSKSDPILKRGRATKKAARVKSEPWKGSKRLDIGYEMRDLINDTQQRLSCIIYIILSYCCRFFMEKVASICCEKFEDRGSLLSACVRKIGTREIVSLPNDVIRHIQYRRRCGGR